MLAKSGFATLIRSLPVCMLLVTVSATAQDDPFAEYRAMMGDDNPAIFVIEEGAELWTRPQGPKQASLEQCDLGLGAGVVKGAYAQLPRYFADTQQVMDLEGRLIHCMVTLQGRARADILRKPYSATGDMGTELEALASYIAEQSSGMPIVIPQNHPAEQEAYALGEQLFFYRAGPYDFSCATCHRQSDKRIRLQKLPNLTVSDGAGMASSTWPAYRISQGVVRTMGWRMQDCAKQQRLPQLLPGSEAVVALIEYMSVNASGTEMAAPGLKR